MAARNFENILVWQKAHSLALNVYKLSSSFPSEELYGLTNQMRRCSVSIAANIAEGCGRGGSVEMGRYLQIARGSASELQYQILLARDLEYLSDADHQALLDKVTEVEKMLASYRQAVLSEQA